MRPFVAIFMSILAWSVAHNAAVFLYLRLCAPPSLWGWLMSPVVIATPHCAALRWTIDTGATSVVTSWTLLAPLATCAVMQTMQVGGCAGVVRVYGGLSPEEKRSPSASGAASG